MEPKKNEHYTFIKGLMVAGLVILMLIPGQYISSLVTEREERQREVVSEVCRKWAGRQTITGPVLMLPYNYTVAGADGKLTNIVKMAYIMPDQLSIVSTIEPQEKKRSLYRVMLYRTKMSLKGTFGKLPLEALQIAPENVIWKDARIALTTSDPRGIDDQVTLNWNGTSQVLEAGLPTNELMADGISVPVVVNDQSAFTFAVGLSLRGSEEVYFTPVGKTTEASVAANWKDPAFDGQYLPSTSEMDNGKFTAHWKILPISHSFPQYWKDRAVDLSKTTFGVRLISTVDSYSSTSRSIKYAILLVALTFGFFFFLELLQKKRIHPIQYLLVGLALTIFYTLLLSISEYTNFALAYLVAALATVVLISVYVQGIFKSIKTATGFGIALSAVYTYIYIIIQSEDYALLFGSVGLFCIMAIIMHYSRKIDWYARPAHEEGDDEEEEMEYANATPAVSDANATPEDNTDIPE